MFDKQAKRIFSSIMSTLPKLHAAEEAEVCHENFKLLQNLVL